MARKRRRITGIFARLYYGIKGKEKRCPYCLVIMRRSYRNSCPNRPDHMTIDHKMPKSLGGSDDIDNLHLVCHACNREKGTMTHHEYVDFRRNYAPKIIA